MVLKIIQIVLTLALMAMILIQSKGKGLVSGIGSSFTFYRSKRGVERIVFILTIIIAILLIINSSFLIVNA